MALDSLAMATTDIFTMSTTTTLPSQAPPIPPHLIILDVSGRKYRTQKATLQTSPYFQNLLTRWDDCTDRQEDGSYFIDADPDVFQHVLHFMRCPAKFPLFWTKETSFDHALYNALEAEADYFLLHDLRDWIRTKRYVDAVKTVVEVNVLSEEDMGRGHGYQRRCGADVEVESFFGAYGGRRRLRNACVSHEDHPTVTSCTTCVNLIRDFGPQYDEPSKKLTVVTKRIEFDETVCVNTMKS